MVDCHPDRMELTATGRLVDEKHESVKLVYVVPVDSPATNVFEVLRSSSGFLINSEIVVGVVGEFVISHERWPSCGCWSGRTHQEIDYNK